MTPASEATIFTKPYGTQQQRKLAEISPKIRHQRVLATILPKSNERTRTCVICALDLLFLCSSVSFYDPVDPEEGFTKQRASVDVRHLNATSPVVYIIVRTLNRV